MKLKNKNTDFIPLSVPCFQGNEWKYVKDCLDTGWVSSAGKYVNKFEKKVCDFTGSKYSTACVNGTSAIHVSLRILGVAPGDEVIVPALTFIAPVNAVRYLYAEPVFMDCDDYYNIDAEKTAEFINKHTSVRNGFTYNKITGRIIKAIIPVHVFGNAAYLDELVSLCRKRNIKILEDATESLGTRYIRGKFKGRHAGTAGDIGCLSFNGNKIITTGGGGMILTGKKSRAEKAAYLTTQAKDDTVNFVHNETGYNYRLTNIQSAMGIAQMETLSDFIKAKRRNYAYLKNGLKDSEYFSLAEPPDYCESNHWLNVLRFNYRAVSRIKLADYLLKLRIETRPVWRLNNLQKPYADCYAYRITKAEELVKSSLCIPSSVNLRRESLDRIIRALLNFRI